MHARQSMPVAVLMLSVTHYTLCIRTQYDDGSRGEDKEEGAAGGRPKVGTMRPGGTPKEETYYDAGAHSFVTYVCCFDVDWIGHTQVHPRSGCLAPEEETYCDAGADSFVMPFLTTISSTTYLETH